jgi:hypothetical protein
MFFLIGCQVQIDPRATGQDWPPPNPDSYLIGTSWSGSTRGTGSIVTLFFECAEKVIFNEGMADRQSLNYFYVDETRKGYVSSLGGFSVTTEDYESIDFSTWRQFPCGADFTRVK